MTVTYQSNQCATPSSGVQVKTTLDGGAHVQHVNIDSPVDSTISALTTEDYSIREIAAGNRYFAIYSALKDTAGYIEVRIQTPDTTKRAYVTFIIECSLAATVSLWKPTTKTHNATNAIVPMNRNHNSANTSVLTVCHTPDGVESGTAALTEYVGAATGGGRIVVGGDAASRSAFVLEQNQSYLIRAASRTDANALSIILDYFER
jgi:hypothetical protein